MMMSSEAIMLLGPHKTADNCKIVKYLVANIQKKCDANNGF